jgi:hypothetical protein
MENIIYNSIKLMFITSLTISGYYFSIYGEYINLIESILNKK